MIQKNNVGFNDTENSFAKSIQSYASIKRYQCNICWKEFTTKATMKIHITVHTGELTFACRTCGEKFRYSIQLSRHKHTFNH